MKVKPAAARTRIKVCGMTDLNEVQGVVAAGVDAVGFIFAAGSPRKVTPELVRDIVRALPPFVDAVGVFVDEEQAAVEEIIQYCRLTVVQLHGTESPGYCSAMPCRVIKAFRISPAAAESECGLRYDPYYDIVQGYLLDTYHEKMAGGTGQTFDWRQVDVCRPPGPVILAGGLTPENVADAVSTVRPFAVDLNSGVESAPGNKDMEKVARAVSEVRRADKRPPS